MTCPLLVPLPTCPLPYRASWDQILNKPRMDQYVHRRTQMLEIVLDSRTSPQPGPHPNPQRL